MTIEPNAEVRKAGFESGEKSADSLSFASESVGQSYPQHYPSGDDHLGEPLTIREAAKLLGCSPWTVRHSYMPKGLPHLRSGPLGKLIFYRMQVVRWILHYQKKGER
jgi:hypothetical protein